MPGRYASSYIPASAPSLPTLLWAAAAAVLELVEQCRQRNPQQLAQLEAVVAALARVTVLPNEEWHAALTDLQVSCPRLTTRWISWNGRLELGDGLFRVGSHFTKHDTTSWVESWMA